MTVTPPGTTFSSTPPGASVLLEGEDSGFVTPCMIHVDPDESHVVELRLPGFEPRAFRLAENRTYYVIPWSKGVASQMVWHFPLFVPVMDLLFPVRYDHQLHPGRIHVRLKPVLDEAAP